MTLDTDRLKSEAEFHDRWADGIELADLMPRELFEASTSVENRHILTRFGDLTGKRVLDLGSGAGEASVYFALAGAQVTAVDVSPKMLGVVAALAAKHGVSVSRIQSPAEQLPFPDATFDVVFGNGVLHHVALPQAIPEIHRVLKPGGKAGFVEPLPDNPAINLYRRMATQVRTKDETPFDPAELARFRALFRTVEHDEFWLTALAIFGWIYFIERVHPNDDRYWKRVVRLADRYGPWFARFDAIDRRLLAWFPFLGRWCWNMCILVEK